MRWGVRGQRGHAGKKENNQPRQNAVAELKSATGITNQTTTGHVVEAATGNGNGWQLVAKRRCNAQEGNPQQTKEPQSNERTVGVYRRFKQT